ncbi:MAG TPA: hypothetical protein PKA05_20810 [Roseiflexaceae bacterium]|nr:hypothetical protein [Roseiflexaceae bacterium]HMP42833.1 hypothetical protein [Roseiflexaceae bacterium]
MQSFLSHLQVNIRHETLPFYRDLMAFLGWGTLFESDTMLGVGSHETSLWFAAGAAETINNYDGPGVNHIAIGTATQADVDAAAAFLGERGVALLFETPRHRAEFSAPGQTYYQIMFESPDRILFEIVYMGSASPQA